MHGLPLTIEGLTENLKCVAFSLGDTEGWNCLENLHRQASGFDGRVRKEGCTSECRSKNAGSRPCMLRWPTWRLLLPLKSSRGGVKGSRLGEAETSLDFQEQRESKHTLESRCVDLCCSRAHSSGQGMLRWRMGSGVSEEDETVILTKSWES